MQFAHLAQQMFNRPLMLHPKKAELVLAALADRMGLARIEPRAWDDDDADWGFGDRQDNADRDRGYDLLGPAAVIPIKGLLVQRTGSLRPYSGMTGYDGIRQAAFAAAEDPAAKAIVLHVNSGGGDVAGCFDLVDDLYALKADKPIYTIMDEVGFSAAYALGSVGKIFVPRTGGTGSIGVICMHLDMSRALDDAGLKVTIVQYGAKKADGHPEIPLSETAHADLQRDIDAMGELFVETIARNRGLATNAVRRTEAATFLGGLGVTAGLADAVASPAAAFQQILAELA